jgi:hypothetical protein
MYIIDPLKEELFAKLELVRTTEAVEPLPKISIVVAVGPKYVVICPLILDILP